MKVYFLGTNGWYDTKIGNTVCVLVETKSAYIIFDAGTGLYKIDRYIKLDKPVYLFLSHYHLDHVIGLHILNKFNFKQGIDIYGPPGLKVLFERVINLPYSMPISRLNMRIGLHEINGSSLLPLGINYMLLRHSSVCYGYKIISEGRTVVYCTDTGVCRNLSFLAKDADLFIAECSFKSKQKDIHWPHLNPEDSAKIAKKVNVKKLALLHFDAALYLTYKDRFLAEQTAKKIFKNSKAAKDGLVEIIR